MANPKDEHERQARGEHERQARGEHERAGGRDDRERAPYSGGKADAKAEAREDGGGKLVVNPLAGSPQYPVQYEKAHPAEFVLSEASGNRSRDGAYFADPTTVRIGQPVKKTAGATTDKPATYVLAATGADCQAIALYGGTSVAVDGLRIAVLSRDAEVNARLIDWGAMAPAEQIIGAQTLATFGVICRV